MVTTYQVDVIDRYGDEYTVLCTPGVISPLFWGDSDKRAFDLMHAMYELGVNGKACNDYGFTPDFQEMSERVAGYLGGMFLV